MSENNPDYDKTIDALREECDHFEDLVDKYSSHISSLEDIVDTLLDHLDDQWEFSSAGFRVITKAKSLLGKKD